MTASYRTPEAARQAITDKLRAQAANGPWSLADLQRQYAYDQLVERLYRLDGRWIIKGATALLARNLSVRHTIDIDLYRDGTITDVERQLREAAAPSILATGCDSNLVQRGRSALPAPKPYDFA